MKMYKATYQLKSIGEFETLAEAFKVIYDAIKAEKVLLWQMLETTIWIEQIESEQLIAHYNFYQARDQMCKEGHLVNGKWMD